MRFLRRQHTSLVVVVLLALFLLGLGVESRMDPEPTMQERIERQQALCPGLPAVTDQNAGDCQGIPKDGKTWTIWVVFGVMALVGGFGVVWLFDNSLYRR